MRISAPASLACLARAAESGSPCAATISNGSAPRARSSAASDAASDLVASASTSPVGPTQPGSSRLCPASDGDHRALQARRHPAERFRLPYRRPARPGSDGPKARQGLHCGRADDAVVREPDVALELPHRPVGAFAEDPILPASVEPQQVEPNLERAHVVAAVIGVVEVEVSCRPASTPPRPILPRCLCRPGRRPSGAGAAGTPARRARWWGRSCRARRRWAGRWRRTGSGRLERPHRGRRVASFA